MLDAIASGDPERAKASALHHVRENRVVTMRLLFGEGPPTAA